MTAHCPRCGRPGPRRRPEIGVIDTTDCDRCYWERFKDVPSEQQYFTMNAWFWDRKWATAS